MKEPLVSIIIPVYNGANYLKESLESALNQSYKNVEVIVINDGSNDDGETERIALSYNDRIKYYFKENGGVSSALNYGISKMQGDLFSWLSHDDLYFPNKIKSQVEIYKRSNINKRIIVSESIIINNNGRILKKVKERPRQINVYNGNEMFKRLIKGKSLNGCSLLVPKSAFNNTHFDETLHYIQDMKMWTNFAINGYSFILVNEPLVMMRIHSEQQTVRINHRMQGEVERHTLELINNFSKDKKFNYQRLKLVLLYGIELGSRVIISDAFKILNQIEDFTFTEKMKLVSRFPLKITRKYIKKIYRDYKNIRWRKV